MKKSNQAIAFDFGSSFIKMAVGSSKDYHIQLDSYEIFPTPVDGVSDGKIYHKTKISETIAEKIKKYGVKNKNIIVTISSSETILRNFELPKMEESELKEAVKFEMEHLLPEAIENYVIDFTVLDEYEQETDENEPMAWLKVQTAALPKNVVLTYLDTFEKAGLKIDIIDIQSNSIAKLFGGRKKLIKDFDDIETIDKNIAIIDLGNQKTTITIMEYGSVFLNRVINKGGRDITRIIAEILDIEISKAEAWKKENNFLGENGSDEVSYALRRYLEELLDEINKVIEYFISRSIQKKLDRIYLIGGGANIKDIVAFFERYFNFVTRLGNNYRNIQIGTMDHEGFSEDLLYLCNVLGILLRKE